MNNPKQTIEQVTATVADTLERDYSSIIKNWYARIENNLELSSLPMPFEKRTFYLHKLIQDLVVRLRLPADAPPIESEAAREHGTSRATLGYTIPMLIEESRYLQVSIFEVLEKHLSSEESSVVLKSIMTIADEVDSQLKQMLESYLDAEPKNMLRIA